MQEHGKDTQSDGHPPRVIRPGRLQALSHFLQAVGVFILSFVVFQSLGTAIALAIDGLPLGQMSDPDLMGKVELSTAALRVMNLFGSAMSMLATALITPRLFRAQALTYVGADRMGQLKWVALSLLFFFCAFPLMESLLVWNQGLDLSQFSSGLDSWNRSMEEQSNALYSKLFGSTTALDLGINLLLMALIPALAEEFLFRGLLLNSLNGVFRNIHLAVFVTALLFSLLHLQPLKLAPMIFMAVSLGYLVHWTGSIWPAVFAHFANNALAVLSMYVNQGDYDRVLSGDQGYPPYLFYISLVLLPVLFLYLQRKSGPKLNNYYV